MTIPTTCIGHSSDPPQPSIIGVWGGSRGIHIPDTPEIVVISSDDELMEDPELVPEKDPEEDLDDKDH